MDELLTKYRERFNENFPLMLCMGMDEAEVQRIINDSIESDVPYDPDIDKNAVY